MSILKQLEETTKKWLKKHKENGQWVSDYDGDFDLDSCCLDGDFDLNQLKSDILQVIKEEIKNIEITEDDFILREKIITLLDEK